MLPPFVPPSARVPKEPLPLITEFVIERTASVAVAEPPEAFEAVEAVEASASPRAWTSESEVPLPSIDEFVIRRSESEGRVAAEPAPVPPELPQEPARAEAAEERMAGETTAKAPAEAAEEEAPTEADATLAMSAQDETAIPAAEETPPGAVFNDESGNVEGSTPGVSTVEAWTASSMSAAAGGAESAEHATPPAAPAAAVGAPAEDWVADERDAFDWQRVSGLASSPDEARRAADDWAATSWDRGHKSEHEHVAAALVQIARRIRAGELKVEVPQQATAEASLAAVLAALLADGDR